MKLIKPDRHFLACAIALTGASAVSAGDLNPPPGPAAPTMLTLDQIEARTPISAVAGDGSFVHVIDAPGNYYLDQDVVAPAGVNGIEIDASNVRIDLNGFVLSGSTSSINQDGIVVTDAAALEDIHISNGTIREFGRSAIHMPSVGSATLSGLFISNNSNAQKGFAGIIIGVNAGAEIVVIRDCVFERQLPSIIAEQRTVITDCAIDSGSVVLGDDCVVERCTMIESFGRINGDRNIIRNCSITHPIFTLEIAGERNLVVQNVLHPAPSDFSGGSLNMIGPVVLDGDIATATNPFANMVPPH